jgi:hypothetical protein
LHGSLSDHCRVPAGGGGPWQREVFPVRGSRDRFMLCRSGRCGGIPSDEANSTGESSEFGPVRDSRGTEHAEMAGRIPRRTRKISRIAASTSKKKRVFQKTFLFRVKSACGFCSVDLEPPSPAALRRGWGARRVSAGTLGRRGGTNIEGFVGRAALVRISAVGLILSLLLFDNLVF